MDNDISFEYDLDLKRLRRLLPETPGVYMFKDASGRTVYVGKAKSLKKRVLSYLLPGARARLPHKTVSMLEKVERLEVVLTSTEQEAFILESNLIKKFMPRYNVVLRDDKRYPCLRIDLNEQYPRLSIVRKIKKDSAIYFGPFPSAGSVRSTYRLINKVFKLRKCSTKGIPQRTRPCLNYQMGRCLAPCVNKVQRDEYLKIVNNVRLFLEGRDKDLVRTLKKDMFEAAEREDFERAACIRDQIRAIEVVVERRQMVSTKLEDWDVVGVAADRDTYDLSLFFVRKGYVVGSRNFLFRGKDNVASEIIEAFLKQYYYTSRFIPSQILISHPIDDISGISEWFSSLAGRKIVIHCPLKGEKRKLIEMAVVNAKNRLRTVMDSHVQDILDMLKSTLGLKNTPRVIEAMDISNIQGKTAVGAIVSFVDGKPNRQGYRNYKIKNVTGVDDYAMMSELVSRRIQKGELPDLFLVDGGKGHLATVKKILDQYGASDICDVISIAKADEKKGEMQDKIYVPMSMDPVIMQREDPGLMLLMQIRDEVHRRAIQYYRKLARKGLITSELDAIPGVGKKRKKALLQHFRDVRSISNASIEELEAVPEINHSVAKNIVSYFAAKSDRGSESTWNKS